MRFGRDLRAVVDCLCANELQEAAALAWAVAGVPGGSNSRAYRVTRGAQDLLVKIPARDDRNRAAREAAVLDALQVAGVPGVPRLVEFEPVAFGVPVVIQTWLDGETLVGPPESEVEWELLLAHLSQIHGVLEEDFGPRCPAVACALDSIERPADALRRVADLLQEARQAAELESVVEFVEGLAGLRLSEWKRPSTVLCRVDHFVRNYVRTPNGMGSVDWEYAGWGDPASDLAELVSHPAYLSVPRDRWTWVVERYAEMTARGDIGSRFQVCLLIRLAGWAVRCGRAAAGVPVDSDRKRMSHPGFREASRTKLAHYLEWAIEMTQTVF